MGGAAVAEEAVRVRIGVEAERLDLPAVRHGQARDDEAFQVELVMAGPAGAEEALVLRILAAAKVRKKALVHLIGSARDGRADRSGDAAAIGAQPLHRLDGGLDDSADRALPAGMSRADHPA